MNILHRAPGDAVGAAMDEAEDIAGGAHYRCLGAGRPITVPLRIAEVPS